MTRMDLTPRTQSALERLDNDIRMVQMQSQMTTGFSSFLADRIEGLQSSIAAELETRKAGGNRLSSG